MLPRVSLQHAGRKDALHILATSYAVRSAPPAPRCLGHQPMPAKRLARLCPPHRQPLLRAWFAPGVRSRLSSTRHWWSSEPPLSSDQSFLLDSLDRPAGVLGTCTALLLAALGCLDAPGEIVSHTVYFATLPYMNHPGLSSRARILGDETAPECR